MKKMIMVRRVFEKWWRMSPEQREKAKLPLNKREFSKTYKVSEGTLTKWQNETPLVDPKATIPEETPPSFDDMEDFALYLKTHGQKRAFDGLMGAVDRHNPAALKLYYQMRGQLVEKSETVRTFSASDYIEAGQELIRRQRELYEESGVCPVCRRPKILLGEVCVDSGQEHGEDNQVAALAVSS